MRGHVVLLTIGLFTRRLRAVQGSRERDRGERGRREGLASIGGRGGQRGRGRQEARYQGDGQARSQCPHMKKILRGLQGACPHRSPVARYVGFNLRPWPSRPGGWERGFLSSVEDLEN